MLSIPPEIGRRQRSSGHAINPILACLAALLALAVPVAWWVGKKSAPEGRALAAQPQIPERVVERKIYVPAPPEPLPSNLVRYSGRTDVAKLFNEINIKSELVSEAGKLASFEREAAESYQIEFQLRLRVPEASDSIEELASVNPLLPKILPDLGAMVQGGKVSGFYYHLYNLKQKQVQSNITRLERVLSRHNFYDCETILELEHPESKRKVFFMQGEMDVVADGSDGDRMPEFDDYIASSTHFQPTTSYGWPKQTKQENPLVARLKEELVAAEERYKVKGLSRAENASLEYKKDHHPIVIRELQQRSFLIAQEDPFVVIPLSTRKYIGENEFMPLIGDYAAVIHKDRVLPAIVGDYGPTTKTGEASLRITKFLDPNSTPYSRPVSDLEITYVIFPRSRVKPFRPPVLADWRAKCSALLEEIGGLGEEYSLYRWEDRFAVQEEASASSEPDELE
jgi:hypothetical protein